MARIASTQRWSYVRCYLSICAKLKSMLLGIELQNENNVDFKAYSICCLNYVHFDIYIHIVKIWKAKRRIITNTVSDVYIILYRGHLKPAFVYSISPLYWRPIGGRLFAKVVVSFAHSLLLFSILFPKPSNFAI